nr:hypothetical protein [Candidatus Sigynarchaeota archaeon]
MAFLHKMRQLFWSPGEIAAAKPFQSPARWLRLGLVAGMLGMGAQSAWIIPPDDLISIASDPDLEIFANKALGFSLGIVFLLVMWLVEAAILACFKVKSMSPAINGSFAVFAFLPLIAIPIHALYPPHLGRAGDVALIWVLIVGFLAWHAAWLGILLRGGHVDTAGRGKLSSRKVALIACVVLAVEIAGGMLFLANMPTLFRSNINEFFWMWF